MRFYSRTPASLSDMFTEATQVLSRLINDFLKFQFSLLLVQLEPCTLLSIHPSVQALGIESLLCIKHSLTDYSSDTNKIKPSTCEVSFVVGRKSK